LPWGCNQGHA